MRWHRMEDKEVEELFDVCKSMAGQRVSNFIYFLTVATKDYKIKEGIVYRRIEYE